VPIACVHNDSISNGRCVADTMSFTESCSRCLLFSPLPRPTLAKKSVSCIPSRLCNVYTGVRLSCEGGICSRTFCAISAAMAPRSCNQNSGRCTQHLSEEPLAGAQASAPSTIPMKQTKLYWLILATNNQQKTQWLSHVIGGSMGWSCCGAPWKPM
jgi:hypothetical protein